MKYFCLLCAFLVCMTARATSAGNYPQQSAIDQRTGRLVTFDVISGYAYLDDIGLGKVEDIERDGLYLPVPLSPASLQAPAGLISPKDAFHRGALRWSMPIPYVISSPTLARDVAAAIAAITAQTELRFVRRTTEANYIAFQVDPKLVGRCNSDYLGQSPYGGEQHINAPATGCPAVPLEHEIMHAVGFAHEHNRSDRDHYIQVHPECIQPDSQIQYAIDNSVSAGSYDFSSVIHYSQAAFAIGPVCDTFSLNPGITATVSVPGCEGMALTIGQQCGLSAGDIAGINYYYSSNAPNVSGPDINQRGITGSWWRPDTDGQGVELEVFPNAAGASAGVLQGSWFTYDSVVTGGAERERWYTFGGTVAGGASGGTFTLYQNIGGNFNAQPMTTAAPVGTVKLSFPDCDNVTLNYAFTDGTNRNGSIALTRLLINTTCVFSGSAPTSADFGYSGNWYDPATSGQGISLELNPRPSNPYAFLAWYTYAPSGQVSGPSGLRWYTGQNYYVVGSRTLHLPLYQSTGGLFNSPTPPAKISQVGDATLSFSSCSAATLTYSFDDGSNAGLSGRINLSRVGPVPAECGP